MKTKKLIVFIAFCLTFVLAFSLTACNKAQPQEVAPVAPQSKGPVDSVPAFSSDASLQDVLAVLAAGNFKLTYEKKRYDLDGIPQYKGVKEYRFDRNALVTDGYFYQKYDVMGKQGFYLADDDPETHYYYDLGKYTAELGYFTICEGNEYQFSPKYSPEEYIYDSYYGYMIYDKASYGDVEENTLLTREAYGISPELLWFFTKYSDSFVLMDGAYVVDLESENFPTEDEISDYLRDIVSTYKFANSYNSLSVEYLNKLVSNLKITIGNESVDISWGFTKTSEDRSIPVSLGAYYYDISISDVGKTALTQVSASDVLNSNEEKYAYVNDALYYYDECYIDEDGDFDEMGWHLEGYNKYWLDQDDDELGPVILKINNSFSYNKVTPFTVESDILGAPVYSVCEEAFLGNCDLVKVVIPSSVIEIDDKAFLYCEQLASVVLNEGLRFIGKEAFACCSNLVSLRLPDGLEQIGRQAFVGCKRLTVLNIPDSVNTLGYNALSCYSANPYDYGYHSVKEYLYDYIDDRCDLPKVFLEMSEYQFYEVFGVDKDVLLENKNELLYRLLYDGDDVFEDMADYMYDGTNLEFEYKDFVIYYDNWAIGNCGIISDDTIAGSPYPEGCISFDTYMNFLLEQGLVAIGEWTDEDGKHQYPIRTDKALTLTVREGTVGIAEYAFEYAGGWGDVITYFEGFDYRYDSYVYYDFIENHFDREDIWNFGLDAFFNGLYIDYYSDYENEEFFDEYGYSAFPGIDVDYVDCGEYWFNFQKITLPSTLKYINEGAFYYSEVKSIVIPDGITEIEDYTFEGCDNLERIIIPASVKSIGDSAFNMRTNPGEEKLVVVFENIDNIESCDSNAFLGVKGVESMYQLDGVTYFNDWAFSLDPNVLLGTNGGSMDIHLQRIEIVDGTTYINEYFSSLANDASVHIEDIILPDSVKLIGEYAFSGCDIEDIILPDSVKLIGEYAFSGCDINVAYLPDGVTVDEGAFEFADIKFIKIDDNATVGEWAFYEASIYDMTIGDNVTVGEWEFEYARIDCLTIGENFTYEANSFEDCSIQTLYIDDAEIAKLDTLCKGPFQFDYYNNKICVDNVYVKNGLEIGDVIKNNYVKIVKTEENANEYDFSDGYTLYLLNDVDDYTYNTIEMNKYNEVTLSVAEYEGYKFSVSKPTVFDFVYEVEKNNYSEESLLKFTVWYYGDNDEIVYVDDYDTEFFSKNFGDVFRIEITQEMLDTLPEEETALTVYIGVELVACDYVDYSAVYAESKTISTGLFEAIKDGTEIEMNSTVSGKIFDDKEEVSYTFEVVAEEDDADDATYPVLIRISSNNLGFILYTDDENNDYAGSKWSTDSCNEVAYIYDLQKGNYCLNIMHIDEDTLWTDFNLTIQQGFVLEDTFAITGNPEIDGDRLPIDVNNESNISETFDLVIAEDGMYTGNLTIDWPLESHDITVTCYDASGKQLGSGTISRGNTSCNVLGSKYVFMKAGTYKVTLTIPADESPSGAAEDAQVTFSTEFVCAVLANDYFD